MNFFSRKKSPSDLVKSLLKHVDILVSENDEKSLNKSRIKVSSNLSEMKYILYGDIDLEPKSADIDKLISLLFANNAWIKLILFLKKFEFEAKKDVTQLFMFILRRAQQFNTISYFIKNKDIIRALVEGYDEVDIALHCGSILREAIRHEELASLMLNYNIESQESIEKTCLFESFFTYAQKSNFDVASDAFATFKLLLTKHKQLAATFLSQNYDRVFSLYNSLIQSDNYVTKRQSLKLLGEVLLDRSNFSVMMKYINDPENLKIMMNLLRGPSKTIQFEVFHVFKVFVANPKKSRPVLEILLRNQSKLIDFLTKFTTDKDTEQFNEEKQILLTTLKKMKPEEDINKKPVNK